MGDERTSGLQPPSSLIAISWNALDLRELPLFVTEGTHRPRFEPTLNAIQVEHVAAASEGDGQAVLVVRRRVRLVLN